MSKRLLAVNLLLAAAAVFSAVKLGQALSAPRSIPPPAVPPALHASVAPRNEPAPSRPSLAAYGVVATRNLFNPNRTEAVTAAPLPPAARPVLHGVVINGENRLAYLEDPATKHVFGYKTGDTVAGGQVERIEDDRVVIKRPEGLLEVRLKDPSKPRLPSPPVPGAPPGVQPPRPAPPVGPGVRPGILRPRPPIPPQEEAGTSGAPSPNQ